MFGRFWAMEPRAYAEMRAMMARVIDGVLASPAGLVVPQLSADARERLRLAWLSDGRVPADAPLIVDEAATTAASMARRAGRDDLPMDVAGGVAMIHVQGPMMKRGSWYSDWIGACSTLAARRAIEAAVADPDVGVILLRIDTPGGVLDGLAELGDTVRRARESTHVVAQVDGMAASAGYYLASQADVIYAHRMDEVGCIGTRTLLYDYHAMYEKEGVEAVAIDSAPKDRPFKSMGAVGTEITEQHRAEIQRMIDEWGSEFKAAVVRGRPGMTAQDVDAVADGRMWYAPDALRKGLIDGIQTMEETLASLRGRVSSEGRSRMARARVAAMGREGFDVSSR